MCNRMLTASPGLAAPYPLGQYTRMEMWETSELFVWRSDVFWHIQAGEVVAASQKGFKECNNKPLSFCQSSTFTLTFEPDYMCLSLQLDDQLQHLSQFPRSTGYKVHFVKLMGCKWLIWRISSLHLQLHWWLLFQHSAEGTHFTLVHCERQWIQWDSSFKTPHTNPFQVSGKSSYSVFTWSHVFVNFENIS